MGEVSESYFSLSSLFSLLSLLSLLSLFSSLFAFLFNASSRAGHLQKEHPSLLSKDFEGRSERSIGERERRDRIKGAVIGMAIGDSVGFMVEGNPPTHCQEYMASLLMWLKKSDESAREERESASRGKREMKEKYVNEGENEEENRESMREAEESVRAQESESGEREDRRGQLMFEWKLGGYFDFGQYSDDTQLTRELILSIVSHWKRREIERTTGVGEEKWERGEGEGEGKGAEERIEERGEEGRNADEETKKFGGEGGVEIDKENAENGGGKREVKGEEGREGRGRERKGETEEEQNSKKSQERPQSEGREIAILFGERISSLYSSHLVVGCGMATSLSLARLLQGISLSLSLSLSLLSLLISLFNLFCLSSFFSSPPCILLISSLSLSLSLSLPPSRIPQGHRWKRVGVRSVSVATLLQSGDWQLVCAAKEKTSQIFRNGNRA